MPDSMIGTGTNDICQRFKQELLAIEAPDVLEIGTLVWEEGIHWHHKEWAPHASRFIMSDIEAGTDVDIVSDVHDLKEFKTGEFDAVIATSVWEHIPKPWVACKAVARVLKPGGILYIDTHQTFPLHGYPHDYFRFSTEAMISIFGDAGLEVESGYLYPARIIPPKEVTRWNEVAPAFLNVNLMGRKPIK